MKEQCESWEASERTCQKLVDLWLEPGLASQDRSRVQKIIARNLMEWNYYERSRLAKAFLVQVLQSIDKNLLEETFDILIHFPPDMKVELFRDKDVFLGENMPVFYNRLKRYMLDSIEHRFFELHSYVDLLQDSQGYGIKFLTELLNEVLQKPGVFLSGNINRHALIFSKLVVSMKKLYEDFTRKLDTNIKKAIPVKKELFLLIESFEKTIACTFHFLLNRFLKEHLKEYHIFQKFIQDNRSMIKEEVKSFSLWFRSKPKEKARYYPFSFASEEYHSTVPLHSVYQILSIYKQNAKEKPVFSDEFRSSDLFELEQIISIIRGLFKKQPNKSKFSFSMTLSTDEILPVLQKLLFEELVKEFSDVPETLYMLSDSLVKHYGDLLLSKKAFPKSFDLKVFEKFFRSLLQIEDLDVTVETIGKFLHSALTSKNSSHSLDSLQKNRGFTKACNRVLKKGSLYDLLFAISELKPVCEEFASKFADKSIEKLLSCNHSKKLSSRELKHQENLIGFDYPVQICTAFITISEFMSEDCQIFLAKEIYETYRDNPEQYSEDKNKNDKLAARNINHLYFRKRFFGELFFNILLFSQNLSKKTKRFILNKIPDMGAWDSLNILAADNILLVKLTEAYVNSLCVKEKESFKSENEYHKIKLLQNPSLGKIPRLNEIIELSIQKNLDKNDFVEYFEKIVEMLSSIKNPVEKSSKTAILFEAISNFQNKDCFKSAPVLWKRTVAKWRKKTYEQMICCLEFRELKNLVSNSDSVRTTTERIKLIEDTIISKKDFKVSFFNAITNPSLDPVFRKTEDKQKFFYTLFLFLLSKNMTDFEKEQVVAKMPKNLSLVVKNFLTEHQKTNSSLDIISFITAVSIMFKDRKTPVKLDASETETVLKEMIKEINNSSTKESKEIVFDAIGNFLKKSGKNLLKTTESRKTASLKETEQKFLNLLGTQLVLNDHSNKTMEKEILLNDHFVDIW